MYAYMNIYIYTWQQVSWLITAADREAEAHALQIRKFHEEQQQNLEKIKRRVMEDERMSRIIATTTEMGQLIGILENQCGPFFIFERYLLVLWSFC